MSGRRRVIRPTWGEKLFTALCGLGVSFAVVASAALISTWPPETWGDAPKYLGPGAFFGLWVTFTWRRAGTGLYANDHALRVRGMMTTRTVAWADIATIDTEPARSPLPGHRLQWLRASAAAMAQPRGHLAPDIRRSRSAGRDELQRSVPALTVWPCPSGVTRAGRRSRACFRRGAQAPGWTGRPLRFGGGV